MKGKGFKRKIVAGIAVVTVCATGITSVAVHYRDKDFRPDIYENNRDRNDNQIVFPGDDVTLGNEHSDDSEMWEQDENSDESLKPEDRPDSSLLFQTLKVADGTNNGELSNPDSPDNNNDLSNESDVQDDIIYAPDNSKKDGTPDIVVPNDKGNSGDSSGDSTGGGNSGNSSTDDNTGGNNSGDNDGDGSNDKPDNPAKPTEPAKPDNPEPSEPEKPDVDTTVPSVPSDDNFFDPVDPYPDDGDIDIDGDDDYAKYSLEIKSVFNAQDEANNLYMGEYLNDQRVFCSVIVHLNYDGKNKYRLTELNDNFKVDGYPRQITEDEVTFDFYFRPSAEYDWIKGSYTAKIKFSGKLLIQDWKSGEYIEQYMIPMDNHKVYLFPYYGMMNSDSSKLFLGWSKEKNGKSEGAYYCDDEIGAQILYPIPLVDIDDEYTMEIDKYFITIDNSFHYVDLQTLKSYSGDADELIIPEGFEAVDLPVDFDWDTFEFIYPNYDKVYIPSSVITLAGPYDDNPAGSPVGNYTFNVTKEYEVSEDNLIYSSYDGMLLDKNQTYIYDIPDTMEKIDVPEAVTDINFNTDNCISQITFNGAKPAKVDFTCLYNAKIYVPSTHYIKYLAAWGKYPGGNGNVLIADDVTDEYVEDDKAIYSFDGKTLIAVKSDVNGVFVVPEGVEAISSGAFDNCGEIDLLILPDTLKKLEGNSMPANSSGKIVFLGKTAPSVEENTFASDGIIEVLPEAKESYEKSFKNISADLKSNIYYKEFEYVKEGLGGFEYLYESACDDEAAGAIMIKAPSDITYFDENSAPGLEWKEISADAFSNCTDLYMVELPATVKVVGKHAFSDCSSLQGILSYSEDNIQVKEGCFDNTINLRFIAFDALNVEFYNYYGGAPIYTSCYGTVSGYQGTNAFSPSYYIVDMAGGRLLYGVGTDIDGNPADNCYLLGATDNVSGNIVLEDNATEIAAYVFRNCSNEFTVEGLEHIIAIGDSTFEGSGISGEVNIASCVVYVGNSAFRNCKQITKVNLDGSGLSKQNYWYPLGMNAFYGCINLEAVYITGTGNYDLSNNLFYGCSNLGIVNIADTAGIKAVCESSFEQTIIEELILPPSINSVGFGAFNSCSNLRSLTFTSEKPPELYGYEKGIEFYFSNIDFDNGWISVPSDYEQEYIDSWKFYILGWTPANEDMVTEEQLHYGENKVRAMLGLELLPDEYTDVPETSEAPDTYDAADKTDVTDENDTNSSTASEGDFDGEPDETQKNDINDLDIYEEKDNQTGDEDDVTVQEEDKR